MSLHAASSVFPHHRASWSAGGVHRSMHRSDDLVLASLHTKQKVPTDSSEHAVHQQYFRVCEALPSGGKSLAIRPARTILQMNPSSRGMPAAIHAWRLCCKAATQLLSVCSPHARASVARHPTRDNALRTKPQKSHVLMPFAPWCSSHASAELLVYCLVSML